MSHTPLQAFLRQCMAKHRGSFLRPTRLLETFSANSFATLREVRVSICRDDVLVEIVKRTSGASTYCALTMVIVVQGLLCDQELDHTRLQEISLLLRLRL